jgi:protoheme ferro-lyase
MSSRTTPIFGAGESRPLNCCKICRNGIDWWVAGPLSDISAAVRAGLEVRLNADGAGAYRVILGMKHWHPYIEQAVGELDAEGIRRAVGLVLAPHFSSMSIAGYYDYIEQAQRKLGTDIQFERIDSWHLHPPIWRRSPRVSAPVWLSFCVARR